MRYNKTTTMKYLLKKVLVPQVGSIADRVNRWLLTTDTTANMVIEYEVSAVNQSVGSIFKYRSYPMADNNKELTMRIHGYFDMLLHQLRASSEGYTDSPMTVTGVITDKCLVEELRHIRRLTTRQEVEKRFKSCLNMIDKSIADDYDKAYCLLRTCQSRCVAYMNMGRYHECYCAMVNTLFILAYDTYNVFSPLYLYPYLYMVLDLFRTNGIDLGVDELYNTKIIQKAMQIANNQ